MRNLLYHRLLCLPLSLFACEKDDTLLINNIIQLPEYDITIFIFVAIIIIVNWTYAIT